MYLLQQLLFRLAVPLVHPGPRRAVLLQVPGGRGAGQQGRRQHGRVRGHSPRGRPDEARPLHTGRAGALIEIL